MKFSHVLLCLGLIAFGIWFLCFVVSGLFATVDLGSFIGLLMYIPTLLLGGILPVFAGFGYLFHMIMHRHDKE